MNHRTGVGEKEEYTNGGIFFPEEAKTELHLIPIKTKSCHFRNDLSGFPCHCLHPCTLSLFGVPKVGISPLGGSGTELSSRSKC